MVRNRVVLALMACLASAATALSPVETYGPLRIVGNKLCDSAGKPVTLRGMSLGYHNLMGSKEYWNESAIRWVQSDWNASVIRAQIYAGTDLHWESAGYVNRGYASDSVGALDYARRAIDGAIKAGMYVVVDFDFAGGSSNIPDAQRFFATLGTEYGSSPSVIWEIWGGPGLGIGQEQIDKYARSVVPVIRRNSPDNLILIPSDDWGMRPPTNDVLRSAGFGNHAYGFSFDAGNTNYGISVLNDSVPLFASEWGTAGSGGNGVLADSASKAWLHVMDSLGISGCNWGLFDLSSRDGTTTSLITSSALRHRVSITGSWAAEDLTPSGTLVRGYLRSANPAWTLPDSAISVAADRDTAILKKDSVTIRAVARWPQSWKISLKGRSSGKTMSYASPAPVRVFEARWRAGYTGPIGSMSAGEWVDITTTPAGGRDSVYLAPPSTQVRGESWTVRWSGGGRRFVLPEDFGGPGDRVLVRTMHVDGHVESERWGTIGEDGLLACGEELQTAGIRLLELRNGSRSLRRLLPPIARY